MKTKMTLEDALRRIEDIQIGGLGISIMKDSFDELEYKYENYSNILILKKTLDYGSKN